MCSFLYVSTLWTALLVLDKINLQGLIQRAQQGPVCQKWWQALSKSRISFTVPKQGSLLGNSICIQKIIYSANTKQLKLSQCLINFGKYLILTLRWPGGGGWMPLPQQVFLISLRNGKRFFGN